MHAAVHACSYKLSTMEYAETYAYVLLENPSSDITIYSMKVAMMLIDPFFKYVMDGVFYGACVPPEQKMHHCGRSLYAFYKVTIR